MRRKFVDTDKPPARVLHSWLKMRTSMAIMANSEVFDEVEDFEVAFEKVRPGRWHVWIRIQEEGHDVQFLTPYTFFNGRWRVQSMKVTIDGEDQGDFGNDLRRAMAELLGGGGERSTEGVASRTDSSGTGFGSVGQRRASVTRV